VTDPIIFVPLTDPESGVPVIVRVDQIMAVTPSGTGRDDYLVIVNESDMHVLVRETPSEVLDAINDIYCRLEQALRERTGTVS
jgi:hypothetical protein